MIKINLLGKKKRKIFGVDADDVLARLGYKGRFEDLVVYRGQAVKLVVFLVGVFTVSYVPQYWLDTELAKVEAEAQVLEQELNGLQKELASKKEIRGQMTKLQGEEAEVKRQLEVIGSLSANRGMVFKTVERISALIPDLAWLESFDLGDSNVRIAGSAWDYPQVNDFVKGLMETTQFSNVILQDITAVDNPNPVAGIPKHQQKVKNFTIEFNWRGKASGG